VQIFLSARRSAVNLQEAIFLNSRLLFATFLKEGKSYLSSNKKLWKLSGFSGLWSLGISWASFALFGYVNRTVNKTKNLFMG